MCYFAVKLWSTSNVILWQYLKPCTTALLTTVYGLFDFRETANSKELLSGLIYYMLDLNWFINVYKLYIWDFFSLLILADMLQLIMSYMRPVSLFCSNLLCLWSMMDWFQANVPWRFHKVELHVKFNSKLMELKCQWSKHSWI